MIKMAVFVTYTLLGSGEPFTIDPFLTGIGYPTQALCEEAKPEYRASFAKWSLEARNDPDPMISETAKAVELKSITLDCLYIKERN